MLLNDLFVIVGALYLNWSPSRMLAFYYLEFCSTLIAFLIFAAIINKIENVFGALIGAIFICAIAWGLFVLLVDLTGEFNLDRKDILTIYSPYLDAGIYVLGLINFQYNNVKRHLEIDTEITSFAIVLTFSFLFIPGILIFSSVLSSFNPDPKFNLIVSLILVRNIMEYIRYRSFITDHNS